MADSRSLGLSRSFLAPYIYIPLTKLGNIRMHWDVPGIRPRRTPRKQYTERILMQVNSLTRCTTTTESAQRTSQSTNQSGSTGSQCHVGIQPWQIRDDKWPDPNTIVFPCAEVRSLLNKKGRAKSFKNLVILYITIFLRGNKEIFPFINLQTKRLVPSISTKHDLFVTICFDWALSAPQDTLVSIIIFTHSASSQT